MNNNKAKLLNLIVTQEKFVNKNTDEYIYASLSQPPIKIVNKNNSDNELDYTVECPNCGSHVNYGEHTFMLRGHIYCNTKGCREKLCERLGIRQYETNIYRRF